MNILHIIKKLLTTEKTHALGEGQYTFLVHPKATKIDVKMAIKELYGHDVQQVRMITVPRKTRDIRKAIMTKRKQGKKAIVTLKKDAKGSMPKLDITKISKAVSKK